MPTEEGNKRREAAMAKYGQVKGSTDLKIGPCGSSDLVCGSLVKFWARFLTIWTRTNLVSLQSKKCGMYAVVEKLLDSEPIVM